MTSSEAPKDWLKEKNVMFFGGLSRPHINYMDNFYIHPFTLHGTEFPSVEHAFQVAKFADSDPAYAERILHAETPMLAKKLGAEKKLSKEALAEWKSKRSAEVMQEALRAKFVPDSHMAYSLVKDTKQFTLVEKVEDDPTWDDALWGCGRLGWGVNRMGILLTQIRDELAHGRSEEVLSHQLTTMT